MSEGDSEEMASGEDLSNEADSENSEENGE